MVVGAAVSALALAAPADAQEPFFGASLNTVFQEQRIDRERWDGLVDAARAAGVRQGRSDALWQWVERGNPLELDVPLWEWSRTDLMMRTMATHGVHWLPVLAGVPPPERVDRRETHSPPASLEHYARFVSEFARRYGRGGRYWSDNPEVPYLPVTAYEIWNEPNLSLFWRPQVQPDRYAEMYLLAREAIHAVDPEAVAIVGGLTVPMGNFVEEMFRTHPELAGAVDAVGLHPYSRSGRGAVAWVKRLRQALGRLGQGAVPIYITELGWPTQGRYSGRTLSDEDRALALELAANSLARGNCGVRGVVAHSWITPQKDPVHDEDWYGLFAPGRGLNKTGEAYSALIATRPEERPAAVSSCGPLAEAAAGPDADTDGDGLADGRESELGASLLDRDTDDDGLGDGQEARGGTDPARADTDGDLLPDGLELGSARPIKDPRGALRGTSRARFRPDRDPRTRTRALRADSDGDGRSDGREDANRNGRRDPGETNPLKRDRPR